MSFKDLASSLGSVHRAVKVDAHDIAPLVIGILESWNLRCNASIGNTHIQFSKVFGDLIDGVRDLFLIGDVGLVGENLIKKVLLAWFLLKEALLSACWFPLPLPLPHTCEPVFLEILAAVSGAELLVV